MNVYVELLHRDFPSVNIELLNEAFEERAAILEYDADYPRQLAEVTAYRIVSDEFNNRK